MKEFLFSANISRTHLKWREPQKRNRKRVKAIKNKKRQNGWSDTGRIQKNVEYSALYKELSRYQEAGVQLWLDGQPSTSYQIASHVCETKNYMRDYQLDCQDHVCGIGFDKIRKYGKDSGKQVPLVKKLKNL